MKGFVFHRKCFELSPAVSGKLWKSINKKVTQFYVFFLETLVADQTMYWKAL